MKVAWLHNFNRETSGSWMYTIYDNFIRNESDVRIDLIDIGSVNNPFIFLVKLARFSGLLKKYDIIHAQYGSGTGFFASMFSGRKIVSLRGSDWYYYPSLGISERFHSWLACKLTRVSLSRYDAAVVMSERMKIEVSAFNKELPVKVVTDGIDLDAFHPAKRNNTGFRVIFSSVLPGNRLKRFDLANAAFEIFRKNHPDSELVFMNGVPKDEVRDVISTGNVILLTSVHEGWPNIIKEGLACNVPFVSTDVSDLKYIAGRTNSCSVCNDDPVSLAIGLEKVYRKKEDAEDLRKFALQFDVKSNTEKLIELYKQVYEGVLKDGEKNS